MTRFTRILRMALPALAVLGLGAVEARAIAALHWERGRKVGVESAVGLFREEDAEDASVSNCDLVWMSAKGVSLLSFSASPTP